MKYKHVPAIAQLMNVVYKLDLCSLSSWNFFFNRARKMLKD